MALLAASHSSSRRRAGTAGLAVLAERVQRVAATRRLKGAEEPAVGLTHALGTGLLLNLLSKPADADARLSIAARDSVLDVVIADAVPELDAGSASAVSALRPRLDWAVALSAAERILLDERLERIASGS